MNYQKTGNTYTHILFSMQFKLHQGKPVDQMRLNISHPLFIYERKGLISKKHKVYLCKAIVY